MTDPTVASPPSDEAAFDAAALVAEIEEDVARRRATDEYPADLIARIEAEFRVQPDEDPPEVHAVIQASRPLRSNRPVIGPAVVFAKRAVRRLLAWYVHPIAEDQTRFNLALLRDLRAIERRLVRIETPAAVPLAGSPASAAALTSLRHDAYAALLPGVRQGRTLVLGDCGDLIAALRDSGVDAVGPDLRGLQPPSDAANAVDVLERSTARTWAAIVLAGVLPRLSAAETLRAVPAAAELLPSGGILVMDAPQPSPGIDLQPASVDPAMTRWLPPDTVALLCEAAGLSTAAPRPLGEAAGVTWYVVVATRPQ